MVTTLHLHINEAFRAPFSGSNILFPCIMDVNITSPKNPSQSWSWSGRIRGSHNRFCTSLAWLQCGEVRLGTRKSVIESIELGIIIGELLAQVESEPAHESKGWHKVVTVKLRRWVSDVH
jgi:hypothetical protein